MKTLLVYYSLEGNTKYVADKIKDEVFEKEPEKLKNCEKCAYRTFCKPKEFAHELYGK